MPIAGFSAGCQNRRTDANRTHTWKVNSVVVCDRKEAMEEGLHILLGLQCNVHGLIPDREADLRLLPWTLVGEVEDISFHESVWAYTALVDTDYKACEIL